MSGEHRRAADALARENAAFRRLTSVDNDDEDDEETRKKVKASERASSRRRFSSADAKLGCHSLSMVGRRRARLSNIRSVGRLAASRLAHRQLCGRLEQQWAAVTIAIAGAIGERAARLLVHIHRLDRSTARRVDERSRHIQRPSSDRRRRGGRADSSRRPASRFSACSLRKCGCCRAASAAASKSAPQTAARIADAAERISHNQGRAQRRNYQVLSGAAASAFTCIVENHKILFASCLAIVRTRCRAADERQSGAAL